MLDRQPREAASVPAAHLARRPHLRQPGGRAHGRPSRGGHPGDPGAHERVRDRRRRPSRVVPLPPPVREAAAHARRARAGRRAAGPARPRRALVRRAAARPSTRSSTPSPPGDWDLAVEVVAEHWFDLYVRGRRCRGPLARSPRSRATVSRPTPSWPRRWPAPRSTSATPMPPRCISRTPSAAAAGLPEPRRRRYLETMALANLATARLEGDFEGGAGRRRRTARRGGRARRRAPTARARRSCTRCSARRRCGATGSTARARSSRAPSRSRALHGLDYVAVSALSDLALLDVMNHGPAGDQGHAREAIELAARRGWAGNPADGVRAHRARARRVLRPAADRGRGAPASAPRRRPARSAGASSSSCVAHLAARLQGATGAPREGLRILDEYELLHRRGAAPPYEPASLAAMRARLLIAAGETRGGGCSNRSCPRGALAGGRHRRGAAGAGRRRPGRGGRDPGRGQARRQDRNARRDGRRARGARGGRPRRGRRAGGRGSARSSEALGAGRGQPASLAVPRARAPDGGAAAPPDPRRHGAPRGRRRAARRVRRPRAGVAHRRRRCSSRCPSASRRSCATCRPRSRTARSRPSCSSRPTRSRPTCAASTASSTSPAGARPSSARATCGCCHPAPPVTVRARLQREAEQAERQREPVREQPVGERRQHGVAGAHARQREHRGQPGLDEPEPARRDRDLRQHLRAAERQQDEPGARVRADRGQRREQRQVVERPAPDRRRTARASSAGRACRRAGRARAAAARAGDAAARRGAAGGCGRAGSARPTQASGRSVDSSTAPSDEGDDEDREPDQRRVEQRPVDRRRAAAPGSRAPAARARRRRRAR